MSAKGLEDLIKDISPNLLNQECSRRYLASLSKRLKNWKLLSPYLDMTCVEEHSISESSRDYDEQKQSLLFKWKEKVRTSATYRVLINAIYCSEDVDLVEHACQLLQTHDEASSGACVVAPVIPPTLLEYQDNLKHVYKGYNNPIVVGDWPPPPTHKYIKLVLMPKEPLQRGNIDSGEIHASISGHVDVGSTRREVDLEELLKLDSNKRQVILFEGSSGSGKSTLLWHICQKWESGELFQQFTLVLLVQLRDQAVHEAKSLAEMLPFSPSRTSRAAQIREEYAKGIEDIHGEGVLILLDGWDEAPVRLRKKGSLIYDLIASPYKCSIDRAVVAVASRPHACRDLRELSTSRVELHGFTKTSREKYIKEALPTDIACKLIEEIDRVGVVLDLSYPLIVVNLTHIYSACDYTLPTSLCRISIRLLLCYLLRHIWKINGRKTPEALHSLDDLPSPIYGSFHALCKIAYDGIVNEKYTFTVDELKSVSVFPSIDPSHVETLSLLQAKHSLIASGSSTHYHFLHLSFQELCAAYYVVRLPDPELTHKKALEGILLNANVLFKSKMVPFESVCNYYSALTGLNNLLIARQLHALYDQFDWDRETIAQHYAERGITNLDSKCIPSANDSTRVFNNNVALHSAAVESYFVVFGNKFYRFSSFVEFMTESQNPIFVDEVVQKEMRMWVFKHSEVMLSAVIRMTSSLESVTCYGFSETLSLALCHQQNLRNFIVSIFDLINNETVASDFQGLLNVLQTCPRLKDITIRVRFLESVADIAASKLADALLHTSLERCTIDALNTIQDDGVSALAPALSRIPRVVARFQQIGSRSLSKLAEAFKTSHLLTYFEVAVYRYQGDDRAFFGSLKHAISLKTVVLSNVVDEEQFPFNLTSIGRALLSGNLKMLADILGVNNPPCVKKVMEIHTFEYSYIKIDYENGIFIAVEPVGCRNKYHYKQIEPKQFENKMGPTEISTLTETLGEVLLENLYLYAHNVGNKGAMLFGKALCTTTCLKELTVRDCGIDIEGIASLFASLTANRTLVMLDASYNPFGDGGAVKIAELINKTFIEILDISNSNVREKGMVAIASALITNTTLKRLSLHSPDVISQNSEIELGKMLLKNTTLKLLAVHHDQYRDLCRHLTVYKKDTFSTFKMPKELTLTLTSVLSSDEFYCGVKMSPIIASIEIDSASSLGKALWSNNMKEAEDILLLHHLPTGEGHIDVIMGDDAWTVNYANGTIHKKGVHGFMIKRQKRI